MTPKLTKLITLPAQLNDTQLPDCAKILIAAHRHPVRRCDDITRELWQAIINYAEA